MSFVADVVVAALTDDRHANRLYEVTTPEAFTDGMRQAGVPDDVALLLVELFTVILDGRNSPVMRGVEEALGRPARDFSDYFRATAATGVWKA